MPSKNHIDEVMLNITPRVALFSVPAVLLHLVSEIVVVCFLWSLRGQFKAVIEEAELLDDNLGPDGGMGNHTGSTPDAVSAWTWSSIYLFFLWGRPW